MPSFARLARPQHDTRPVLVLRPSATVDRSVTRRISASARPSSRPPNQARDCRVTTVGASKATLDPRERRARAKSR
jgi:hypothetical protein